MVRMIVKLYHIAVATCAAGQNSGRPQAGGGEIQEETKTKTTT